MLRYTRTRMSQRKPLIAANWKMNASPEGWDAQGSPYRPRQGLDVVIFPTFLDIPACRAAGYIVGGQYGRPEAAGAFTGDIGMQLLKVSGCQYVLCGHSERRQYHGETDANAADQVRAALEVGLTPIACIGETGEERKHGQTKAVIERQVRALPAPPIIAYEPRWAIGSATPATPEHAQEVHAFIRSLLPAPGRESTRILYGGSVTAENAPAFLAQRDIDGLLVGGASLDLRAFRGIVDASRQ